MKITIATLETRSYSFTAVGLTRGSMPETARWGRGPDQHVPGMGGVFLPARYCSSLGGSSWVAPAG